MSLKAWVIQLMKYLTRLNLALRITIMTSEGISAQDFLRFERKTQRASEKDAIDDVQSIVFQERDNPPWYQSTAETYDRLQAGMTAAEIEQCSERIGREFAAWKAKDELYKNKNRTGL